MPNSLTAVTQESRPVALELVHENKQQLETHKQRSSNMQVFGSHARSSEAAHDDV